MTAPIEAAYDELLARVREAVVAGAFLASGDTLLKDPETDWEPTGEEGAVVSAAALFRGETKPVRAILGVVPRRWVVERQAMLVLASAGPLAAGTHEDRFTAAVDAVAALPEAYPTLNGLCERFELVSAEDQEMPPNGARKLISFTIRLRAGDRLGRASAA